MTAAGVYAIGDHDDCGAGPILVDRFTQTGSLDTSFGTARELALHEVGGQQVLNSSPVGAQPNGQILAFASRAPDPTSPEGINGAVIRLLPTIATPVGPQLDTTTSSDNSSASAQVVSPTLTTSEAGELLVAFISADGPPGPKQRVTAVAGGGLVWTVAAQSNDAWGTAEVWHAYATGPFTSTVTATLSQAGFHASITVAAFANAGTTVAATEAARGRTNHPQITITTTAPNSLVWAVGHDGDRAGTRTPDAGQLIVHQFVDPAAANTFWTQTTTNVLTQPGTVTLGVSAPDRDRWEMAAVEIPIA